MSKALYVRISRIAVHGDLPADGRVVNPMLYVGSMPTGFRKYNTILEDNPSVNDGNVISDFSERAVDYVSFDRPSGYGINGDWTTLNVPDNFSIPDDQRVNVSKLFVDNFIGNIKSWAEFNKLSNVVFFIDRVNSILKTRSLYDMISEHMKDQFVLMNKALNNEITPQELLKTSDEISEKLQRDLLSEANLPKELVDIFKAIRFEYKGPNESTAGFAFPGGLILPNNQTAFITLNPFDYLQWGMDENKSIVIFGSASDDIIGSNGDNIVITGDGNDTLKGWGGNDYLAPGRGADFIDGGDGIDTVMYSTNSYQASLYANSDGSWNVVSPEGVDTVKNVENISFKDKNIDLNQYSGTVGNIINSDKDFNADGTSDILFRHGSNGNIVLWQMNNSQVHDSTSLGNAGSYQVVGTGDLNGDGTDGIVFQNGASVVAWRVQKGQLQSSNALGNAGGYKVAGTGDFNGDGISDVLFQQGASIVAWRMQNGQVQSSTGLGNAGSYQVVGTGDLNGDGTDDIVFQNGAAVAAWIMGNGQVQSVANLGNAGGYRVAGVGDLNRDGRADLVFQNGASVVDWIVGGNGQVQSARSLGNAGGYTVSDVGDYTGDGTADVLFQQGPSVVAWEVQNGQVQSLLNLGNAGSYTVVG